MNRRDFLATVGATTVVAGCTSSEGDSTPQDTETSGPSTEPSEELVDVTDHYFEKFATSDVDAFVTVNNSSELELRVEFQISVFAENERLESSEGVIGELPSGISQEVNTLLLDLDNPEQVTRYTITVRACPTGTGYCDETEPVELEFNGDEYRERLEGEWA